MPTRKERRRWYRAAILGTFAAATALRAADTNAPPAAAPPPLTPQQFFEGGSTAYTNWIEFSAGGFFNQGNRSQFEQQYHNSGSAFGGISDFHYQRDIAKGTTLITDGRLLFDDYDYKFNLDLKREKLGFLRFSFSQFRTWYGADGGFYPPTGAFYRFPLSDDALALDRGRIVFEGGLLLEKKDVPNITFKYEHDYRTGEKSSSIWGIAHPDLGVSQGLSPSFYSIDERSDSFQIDLTHHYKATDFGAGLRYETGKLDNALKINEFPGEPVEDKITDRQGTTYDMFNVHAFTETWLKKTLMFSSGFSYTDLDNNFSGSRIYGSDYDVGYVPAAQNGFGYTGLSGGSRLHDYVLDLNLFYKPSTHLTIVPSVRVQKEDTEGIAGGSETFGTSAPVPFTGNSDASVFDLRERLDLTYNGITNWVTYARGEWTEGSGNLNELGGYDQLIIAGAGVPGIQRETEDSRFFQKYSAGVRWYPTRILILDAGGYFKDNEYSYSHNTDSTPNNSGNRYPAYLTMQSFQTYDANFRLTLRPVKNVSFVGRYEFQYSDIQTRPDPVSGLGEEESSTITSDIVAVDVNWTPWSRLYLQAGVNYVLSETKTPASEVTQAILNAQNNYTTVNVSAGLVLDDKTDLNVSLFHYLADNYQDNSPAGVSYGAGSEEYGVNATLIRRLTKNLRLTLKYGYFQNRDQTFGGNYNFASHMAATSLQYRF